MVAVHLMSTADLSCLQGILLMLLNAQHARKKRTSFKRAEPPLVDMHCKMPKAATDCVASRGWALQGLFMIIPGGPEISTHHCAH